MTFVRRLAGDDRNNREWPVPANTKKGTPVLSASNQAGITLTNRGDVSNVYTVGPIQYTQPSEVGLKSDSAVVATDGSFSGPVTGATSATVKNTLVYFQVSDGTLTLTVGSNIKFGVVDAYLGKASASDTTVRIGVYA